MSAPVQDSCDVFVRLALHSLINCTNPNTNIHNQECGGPHSAGRRRWRAASCAKSSRTAPGTAKATQQNLFPGNRKFQNDPYQNISLQILLLNIHLQIHHPFRLRKYLTKQSSAHDNVFENGILPKILDFAGLKPCIDLKIFLGKQKHICNCQKTFF